MKKFLSAAALLLAVLMIAMSCVACGENKADTPAADTDATAAVATQAPAEDPTPASIVGKWKYDFSFDVLLDAVKDEALEGATGSQKEFMEIMFTAFNGVSMTMIMEFDANGTVKTSADKDSVDAAFAKIKENLKALMPDMFAALGVSSSDIDSQLAAAGYTMDQYVDLLFSQMDTASLTDQMSSEDQYRLDGDKLYGSDDDSYVTVEITATTLKITGLVGDDGSNPIFTEKFLPMVLTRI